MPWTITKTVYMVGTSTKSDKLFDFLWNHFALLWHPYGSFWGNNISVDIIRVSNWTSALRAENRKWCLVVDTYWSYPLGKLAKLIRICRLALVDNWWLFYNAEDVLQESKKASCRWSVWVETEQYWLCHLLFVHLMHILIEIFLSCCGDRICIYDNTVWVLLCFLFRIASDIIWVTFTDT